MLILSREYESIMLYYDDWIKRYTMNRYSDLKRLYTGNYRDRNYGIMVLILLYIGRARVINVVYSELLIE